jgi:putative transcriptional regulator
MAIVRFKADLNAPARLSQATRGRLDGVRAEEIERKAREDSDNPPATDEELDRGVFARSVRLARQRLGLSQTEFAARFRINIARLKDWEQGRSNPDSVALAYLTVIEREPDAVERALGAA